MISAKKKKTKVDFAKIRDLHKLADPTTLKEACSFAKVQSQIQDTSERKKYAKNIFYLTVGWLCIVLIILVFS